jgi:hypothetical protein
MGTLTAAIALLLTAAAGLAPAAGLDIRTSSGPSKYAGGLVRDPSYTPTL